MIPMQQVQRGLAAWMDAEIFPHLDDMARLIYGTGAGLVLRNSAALPLGEENGLIKMLGVFDADGGVDVEAISEQLRMMLRIKPAKLTLPAHQMPLLGEIPGLSITLTEQSINDLLAYIYKS